MSLQTVQPAAVLAKATMRMNKMLRKASCPSIKVFYHGPQKISLLGHIMPSFIIIYFESRTLLMRPAERGLMQTPKAKSLWTTRNREAYR